MSLREDFYDLAYELAKIANDEIDKIEKRAMATIDYNREEMDKKIRKDLEKLQKNRMNEELFGLNIDESERIAQINQAVAEQKGKSIKDFVILLKSKVSKMIEAHPREYFDFMRQKMYHFLPLLDQNVEVRVNQRDYDLVKQKPLFNTIQKNKFHVNLSKIPIETVGGFRIIPEDGSFEIDYTFESQIEKYRKDLAMKFMEIFPVFKIDVKNAIELEKEKHEAFK